MDKSGPYTLGEALFLYFSIPGVTDAVIGDFATVLVVNGAADARTLYLTHIGSGVYHLSNRSGGDPWLSSVAEDVYLSATHTPTGRNRLFHFRVAAAAEAPPSAETIAAEVWDSSLASHVASGSFGAKVQAVNDYKADVSALATAAGLAVVEGKVDAIPTDPAPSAADVADAVWDEATAGHAGAGTFGASNQIAVPSASIADYRADVSTLATSAGLSGVESKIDAVGSSVGALPGLISAAEGAIRGTDGDDLKSISDAIAAIPVVTPPTAGEIADAVWDEATAGHGTAGTFGALAQDVQDGIRRSLGLLHENAEIEELEHETQVAVTGASVRVCTAARITAYTDETKGTVRYRWLMAAAYSQAELVSYSLTRETVP